MPKRLEAPQMRRSHCVMTSSPPPTQTPWIIATIGCRHRAIAPIVASSTAPYFFALFAFLRVVSNSEMSAPAAKALSPAPRITTQRKRLSASSSRMTSPSRFQEPSPSAFSLPGLLSVTVAMSPSRSRRISPDMSLFLCVFPDESAPHPAGRCADHRQAERVLGAVPQHKGKREGRKGNTDLLEHVADDTEDEHQPDVEHGVLDRAGSIRARHHDDRADHRE